MRRSWHVASASDTKQLDAALIAGADAFVIDLSHAGPEEAAHLRAQVADWLVRHRSRLASALYVMVHAASSALLQDDIIALTPFAPDGFIIPESAGGADIQKVDVMISAQEAVAGIAAGSMGIVALPADTSTGVFGGMTYARKSTRLQALAWSADRLAQHLKLEDWQLPDGRLAPPLETARDHCLIGAAAASVASIDLTAPSGDPEHFTAECRRAKAMGFSGKLAANARQVEIINTVFAP
ncbi:aldolase/citrate lyase family protein [Rhizobium sp. BK251]|uniref:aldolase/citrate lyase family protein n=1 Tax=Rhizobium sp. BK251 TaxID=2512125 RepID=UPI0010D11BD3|nr:aldolase/citrate lyase family protein [Rhizobium sp. BK251]TCL73669.1 citrate lyase subunit beta/citryl-CoA lyase [Rhizobium sp. BK251]